MEEIAVMNPIGIVTNDEMSDESISLDLHVSDTDESEECNAKRSDGEEKVFNRRISAESEDDILNKYVTDSPLPPSADLERKVEDDSLFPNENDVLLPKNLEDGLEEIPANKECEEDDILGKNGENIICNGGDDVIHESADLLKTTEESADTKNGKEKDVVDTDVSDENLEIKKKGDIMCNGFEVDEEEEDKENESLTTLHANVECHKNSKRNNGATKDLSLDQNCERKDNKVCNGEVDESSSDSVKKDNKIHSSSDDKPQSCDTEKQRDEKLEETEDNEDLLQVMDEQSVDDAEQEIKDDHSCSSSEKDDESGDNPEELSRDNHEELSRDNNEELSRDNHEEGSVDNNDELRENNEESSVDNNDEPRENNEVESMDNEEIKDTVENGQLVEENEEDNHESQIDVDMEEGECPMDIEENDIGAIFVDQSKRKESLQRENSVNIDIEDNSLNQPDKEANKENEGTAENKENEKPKDKEPVKTSNADTANNNIVISSICDEDDDVEMDNENDNSKDILDKTVNEEIKRTNKRQLSNDFTDEGESSKKMRIEEPNAEEEEKKKKETEKYTVTRLNNFKQFMLDKKLKKLTRFELEELCMQKMCECIINKSEIGELRQKIRVQEQAIDTWRKEAVVVAKQTRDLKIVHERLIADLKVMKEQSGKPLVPVKITRSVGLQAIIENTTRARPVVNGITTPQRATPVTTPTKTVTTTARQPIKKVLQRTISKPLQAIGQNDGGATTPKLRQVQPLQGKKNAEPKAVIDLTDEDEKNQTSQTSAPINTASPTIRIINKPSTNNVVSNNNTSPKLATNIVTSSSPKIMIMSPSVLARPGGTVMLKVNSNNLVSSANGIIPAVQNGQVSVVATQPIVRSVQQVRVPVSSTSSVRTATPVKTVYKHPAPLPAPPAMQQNIVAKKPIPPRPHLNLTRSNCGTGIVLQWKMPYKLDMYESIVSYQLYAYQETKSPPRTDNWGKIGDVKALDLPMAVTLTQFAVGNRYFFAVRAVDVQKRLGPFSEPQTILL